MSSDGVSVNNDQRAVHDQHSFDDNNGFVNTCRQPQTPGVPPPRSPEADCQAPPSQIASKIPISVTPQKILANFSKTGLEDIFEPGLGTSTTNCDCLKDDCLRVIGYAFNFCVLGSIGKLSKELLSGDIIFSAQDHCKSQHIEQHFRDVITYIVRDWKTSRRPLCPITMSLNTELGWSGGDDVRVLVAAGLPVGIYQVTRIQQDMNYLAAEVPSAVFPILDLLDAWDTAQSKLVSLNETSEGRILTKVDVLEWATTNPGTSYSPERELQRIRGLLYQYFASSTLFAQGVGHDGLTTLVRS